MKRRAHDLVSGKGIQLYTSYMVFNLSRSVLRVMAASAFLVRTGKKREHFLGSCSLCGSSTTGLYPEDISLSLIFDLL